MKVRSLLFGMLCMLALGASLASCSDDDDDSLDDGGSKVTLPQTRVLLLYTEPLLSIQCFFHKMGGQFLFLANC